MKPPSYDQPTKAVAPLQGVVDLTAREWEVLIRVADDLTNTEIAEQLFLSTKSVVNYRNRIGSKLNRQGTHKLAQFARNHREVLHQWYELLNSRLPPPPPRLSYINDWPTPTGHRAFLNRFFKLSRE